MANTAATSPGTMANDATVGTVAWVNPDNAKVSDNVYTTTTMDYHGEIYEYAIKIVKSNGTIGTTNKSTGAWLSDTEGYHTYGSLSNLWGESWTPADINSANFGMVFAHEDTYVSEISNYLKATNFNFSIPTGATINGIKAEVETSSISDGPFSDTDYFRVDHIRITIYYTDGVSNQANFLAFF